MIRLRFLLGISSFRSFRDSAAAELLCTLEQGLFYEVRIECAERRSGDVKRDVCSRVIRHHVSICDIIRSLSRVEPFEPRRAYFSDMLH